jgi:hypothetical protein
MLHVKRPEQQMQIALLQWAQFVQVGAHTLADWLHHSPNGGARSAIEGAILKAMGVKAGEPDLVLPIATTKYSHGYWELKASPHERPTDKQLERHGMLRAGGAYVRVCHRWDEAALDMLQYLEQGPFTVIVRARP